MKECSRRARLVKVFNWIVIILGLIFLGLTLFLGSLNTATRVVFGSVIASFMVTYSLKDGWFAVAYFAGVILLVGALTFFGFIPGV